MNYNNRNGQYCWTNTNNNNRFNYNHNQNDNRTSTNHRSSTTYDRGRGSFNRSQSQGGHHATRFSLHHNGTAPNATSSGVQSSSMDIDGFYFDATRNRYFRIMPSHAGYDQYTQQALNFRRQEQERVKLMDVCQETPVAKPMTLMKRLTSLQSSFMPAIVMTQQTGHASRSGLLRHLSEKRLLNAPKQASTFCPVLEDCPDVNLDSCQFLDVTSDGKMALGCWSVRQSPWGTRIMCLQVESEPKRADERHYGLTVKPTGNFIYTVDRNVVDICQAKMDSSVTCILYVTVPTTERGSRIFLQPLPEISDICDQEFLESPIYNAHWAISESTWSCAWEPRHMRVSLGLERCGIIMDVVAEKDFKLYSRQKNVLTQRFSKDGNLLFMGLRSSEILCCDLRLKHHHTIFTLPQTSTCWISMLNDNNYLLAANYFGEVKLWDLRKNQVVQTFCGLKNTHTKTPMVVSEDESVAFAVGEDGTTKGWSLKSGQTLCTIPAPYAVPHRDCIPRLCYSNRWAGRYGNAAIALGVRDELHFYELTAL